MQVWTTAITSHFEGEDDFDGPTVTTLANQTSMGAIEDVELWFADARKDAEFDSDLIVVNEVESDGAAFTVNMNVQDADGGYILFEACAEIRLREVRS